MSSDDKDKTVFRPPAAGGDRTVIRPTPGRRGNRPAQPAPAPEYASRQPASPSPSHYAPVETGHATFQAVHGLNPLVNLASTLIAVFEKIRSSVNHQDVSGLHQNLTNSIRQFEMQAKQQGIKSEIVLSARYALCVALDEAVLNTPWGSESAWTQRTLLSVFHNETAGGEKFFQILDRLRQTPAENIYILELYYILLSLGFEGKYRVTQRGRDALETIRDELFKLIRNFRGDFERELSPQWHGLGRVRNSLMHLIPLWVIASFVGLALLVSYSGFRIWLYQSSAPVAEQLEEVSKIRTVPTQDALNKEQN